MGVIIISMVVITIWGVALYTLRYYYYMNKQSSVAVLTQSGLHGRKKRNKGVMNGTHNL